MGIIQPGFTKDSLKKKSSELLHVNTCLASSFVRNLHLCIIRSGLGRLSVKRIDSQASCRALEKCVGAPTVFTREVRYVNTRCAKCGKNFFFRPYVRGTPSRQVGPASPKTVFRANCRRPPLTTAAQAGNLPLLPLLSLTQVPSGWTEGGLFSFAQFF